MVTETNSVCVCVCETVSSVISVCNPMDCNLLGSSVHGILQARILEWVATPSFRGSSWPKDPSLVSCISCIAGRFFITEPTGEAPQELTVMHTLYVDMLATLFL